MVRIIFTYVLPFLLPTLIYASWVWFRVARRGGEAPRFEQGPWPLLLFLGAALAVGMLGAGALTRGGLPGEHYVPAHVEAGKIVPGYDEAKKP